MATLLALSLLAGLHGEEGGRAPTASELTLDYTFDRYLRDFSKSYGAEEYAARRALFETKLAEIVRHNEAVRSSTGGGPSYVKGVNHMTDLTDDEFAKMLGGRAVHVSTDAERFDALRAPLALSKRLRHSASDPLPEAVDWRACTPWADSPLCPLKQPPKSSVVTPVKNQGHCGSCWAFASTATLESHFSLQTGRSEALSPQHLVSCTPNVRECGGTGGCAGSTADVAYGWLTSSGGLASEFTYGYTSGVGGASGACEPARTVPLAALDGIGKPQSNDYAALMAAVATVGPVAVNVYASGWKEYAGGVFDGCDYAADVPINHVVVLEGYGVDESTGLGYWLVRNSWSTAFGERGYIRLLREPSPVCGVDHKPADGWDCKPYPPSVKVCGMCGVAYQPTYPTGVRVANASTTSA